MENNPKNQQELKAQIEKDQHFIDKMREMGERWCSYTLIAEAMKKAAERIEENKAKLEG